MSVAARKFLFDLSFDSPAAKDEPQVAAIVAPAPPSFTESDLEGSRVAGFADGRAAGLAEAATRDHARTAAALERIAAGIGTLLEHRTETAHAIETSAVELILNLARKTLPEASKRLAFEELTGLVRGCLEDAFEEPRIAVRVPDALFDAAKESLDTTANAAGYAGKLVILADPALGPDDARVEWADGGAERDMTRFWAEIDEAAKRAVATLTQFRGE
jgi:flagellar assembly protein FliH